VRERELERLLEGAGIMVPKMGKVLLGLGDDAGAVRIQKDLAYVTHTDFFTPIIDDPYLYGKIAVCNAASDVFAKGAVENIGILVIMGFPLKVPIETMQQVIRGIQDFCSEVNAAILGGHTITNPWPIVGAAVTASAHPDRLVGNSTAKPSDRLVLTKPLGTQPSMGALRVPEEMRNELTKLLPNEKIEGAISLAVESMTTPNKNAAEAMLEVEVDAATDITGFGILGHSGIMAKRSHVDIEIHTLPVINGTLALSKLFGYGLEEGTSAETSGGLLMSVPKGKLDNLRSALERRKVPAYEVGIAKKGVGEARLVKGAKVFEVSSLR
jgi:selenide,water dikinase